MAKVVIISEFSSPEENSTGYFWNSLANKLSEHHKTIMISPSKANDDNKFTQVQVKSYTYNKNKILSRLTHQLILTIKFFILGFKHLKKDDLLICGTNPAIVFFILPILKKIKKTKLIILVHDVMPMNLIPSGMIKEKNILYRILKKTCSISYRSADHIVTIGSDMRSLITKSFKLQKNKISVIPNWVDHKDVEPIAEKETIIYKKLNLNEDHFVITFFGNLGRLQGIENVLSATKLVKHHNARFVFIGDGFFKKRILDFIQNESSKNVIYYGSIPQSEKTQGLNACNISLVTLASGMLGLGVPSKAYFSMAANKPLLVVMEEEAEVAQMCIKHDIGWVCPPNDPINLANMIDEIIEHQLLLTKSSPRDVLIEHYSENEALDKFSKLINRTLS